MQVVFGNDQAEQLKSKMTVLELDTFFQEGLQEPITAFAVLESNDIPVQDLMILPNLTNLHEQLMVNYRKQNWSFCNQALEHLEGKWNKSMDSFYEIIKARVVDLSKQPLPTNWDGVIYK